MTIDITDAGPVEDLSVPVPDGGGITVIRGMNDDGKSESLKAVQKLLGGDEKITKRRGSKRGSVEGLGATLTLMANVRAAGECMAVSLEGELSIGTLIDPQRKDPVAADRARIEALLAVRGVEADLTLFDDLYGVEAVASDDTRAAPSLIVMAARLKRDLEVAKRKYADDAKTAEVQSRGKRESAEGLDLDAASDAEKLQAALEEAIRDQSAISQIRDGQCQASRKMALAKRELAEAESRYDGPAYDEASLEAEDVATAYEKAATKVTAVEQHLESSKGEESRLETALAIAEERRTAAKQHEQSMAGWRKTVEDAGQVQTVSNADITDAGEEVYEAREAVENGVRIRDAKESLAQAVVLQAGADRLRMESEKLRDAAAGTNDVLAEAVKAGSLIPVTDDNGNFRFAVESEGDQRVYYHDLGPGRRTALAVMEVASCLRDADAIRAALVVLPQSQWEGLDWENRQIVDEHVRRLGLNLITAECDKDQETSGGIRAEVFVS